MSANQTYTDSEMLLRIADGDERAFTNLVQKYRPRLLGYIAGITKSNTVAEEIVMDVFLKLWFGRGEITTIQNMDGFLFKIAYHFSLNFLKKLGRENRLNMLLWDRLQHAESMSPDQQLIGHEYETLLRNVVSLMPEQRRKVYQLSREEALTYQEIATRLSISKNTVSVHITEARNFIRTHLLKHIDIIPLILLMPSFWRE